MYYSSLGALFGVPQQHPFGSQNASFQADLARQQQQAAFQAEAFVRAYRPAPAPNPPAKIGKITPKPGYILDWSHPDKVRAKVPSDYTRLERLVIWWNNLD